MDPLGEKYPSQSPFNYVYNNPISHIDQDGREGIVISGQPGTTHKVRTHFLENGLDRALKVQKEFKKSKSNEAVTWMIYNTTGASGFNEKDLNSYKKKAAKAGIKVQVVSEVDDIKDYINKKDGGTSRESDKISKLYYVGHATPGDLNVGYNNSDNENHAQSFDGGDVEKEAFASGCEINLVAGCRTAVSDDRWWELKVENSVAYSFAQKVDNKSIVKGSNVRTEFGSAGVDSEEELLKANKGKIVELRGKLKPK